MTDPSAKPPLLDDDLLDKVRRQAYLAISRAGSPPEGYELIVRVNVTAELREKEHVV